MIAPMTRRVSAAMVAFVAVAATFTSAHAAFHLMKINEVYAGSPDSPNAQFIELIMYAAGQNQVQNHAVQVYSAGNVLLASFTFAGPVPNSQNQSKILVATSDAQTYFGVTADLAMTPAIPAGGGKVCFDTIDCVSWGGYAGPGTGTGTPFNRPEGLVAGASAEHRFSGGTNPNQIDAGDDTDDSTADFLLGAPSPQNNAGAAGTACCSVGFAAQNVNANEGDSVVVSVSRSPAIGASTVDYATQDGSARAGEDYTAASGTLSFAQGEASKSFVVSVASDAVDEYDETITLSLRNPSVGVLSPPSSRIVIKGSIVVAAPGAPRNLTATGGSGQIMLAWQAPLSDGGSAITSYKIYYSSGYGQALLATVPGAQLSYTDSGLGGGVTRTYAVSAVNAVGEGPQSNSASATTSGTADRQPPSHTMSTRTGTVIVSGQPAIQGTASDAVGVTSVKILVYTVAGSAVRQISAECIPACPAQAITWRTTLSSLTPGLYLIRSQAFDAASNASAYVDAQVLFVS